MYSNSGVTWNSVGTDSPKISAPGGCDSCEDGNIAVCKIV